MVSVWWYTWKNYCLWWASKYFWRIACPRKSHSFSCIWWFTKHDNRCGWLVALLFVCFHPTFSHTRKMFLSSCLWKLLKMCTLGVENLEANTEVEISLSAKSNYYYTNLVTFWTYHLQTSGLAQLTSSKLWVQDYFRPTQKTRSRCLGKAHTACAGFHFLSIASPSQR